MTTHAAVWLEFDAPADPPAPHESVCGECFLVFVAAHDDCPNCYEVYGPVGLRIRNFPDSYEPEQRLLIAIFGGPNA